jgi:hypothetical protein
MRPGAANLQSRSTSISSKLRSEHDNAKLMGCHKLIENDLGSGQLARADDFAKEESHDDHHDYRL